MVKGKLEKKYKLIYNGRELSQGLLSEAGKYDAMQILVQRFDEGREGAIDPDEVEIIDMSLKENQQWTFQFMIFQSHQYWLLAFLVLCSHLYYYTLWIEHTLKVHLIVTEGIKTDLLHSVEQQVVCLKLKLMISI